MDGNYKYSEITTIIIKAYYEVYNSLGYGFLEKVYENAMVVELKDKHLTVAQQLPIDVFYNNKK
ncbi:MAG TPA: GxxExxY protein [Chitinophagaceae bacterium]|nr:GxxExxY protein [Chitinophagaceae bacterium]